MVKEDVGCWRGEGGRSRGDVGCEEVGAEGM